MYTSSCICRQTCLKCGPELKLLEHIVQRKRPRAVIHTDEWLLCVLCNDVVTIIDINKTLLSVISYKVRQEQVSIKSDVLGCDDSRGFDIYHPEVFLNT